MLLQQGKEAEARSDFDRALKLDPGINFQVVNISLKALHNKLRA